MKLIFGILFLILVVLLVADSVMTYTFEATSTSEGFKQN